MTLRLQNTDPSLPGSIILYLSLRRSKLASTSTNHSAFVSDGLPSTARWKPVVSEGCTCESVMTISIISVKMVLPTWSRTVLAKLLKGLLVVRVPTRILPSGNPLFRSVHSTEVKLPANLRSSKFRSVVLSLLHRLCDCKSSLHWPSESMIPETFV